MLSGFKSLKIFTKISILDICLGSECASVTYAKNLLLLYQKSCHNKALIKFLHRHCVKSVRFWSFSGPYSIQMRENTDQKNSEYGYSSRSEFWSFYSDPFRFREDYENNNAESNTFFKGTKILTLTIYNPGRNTSKLSKFFLQV